MLIFDINKMCRRREKTKKNISGLYFFLIYLPFINIASCVFKALYVYDEGHILEKHPFVTSKLKLETILTYHLHRCANLFTGVNVMMYTFCSAAGIDTSINLL